jgi:hypothetical protein
MKMSKLVPFILFTVLVAAGLPAVDLPAGCGDCGSCVRSDHIPEHISGLSLDHMYLKPISLTGVASNHCSFCRTSEQPHRDESLVAPGQGKISFFAITAGYSSLDCVVVGIYNSRFFRESANHTSCYSFYLRC